MNLDLPLIEWSRHHRCLPADGDLDVSGFLAAVLATGYQGPISLEIFGDALKLLPAEEIARRGMRSLISLERQIETAFAPTNDGRWAKLPHGYQNTRSCPPAGLRWIVNGRCGRHPGAVSGDVSVMQLVEAQDHTE
jgi:hypothetical protein